MLPDFSPTDYPLSPAPACPRCPFCGGPWPPFDLRARALLDLVLVTTESLRTATAAARTLLATLEEETLP